MADQWLRENALLLLRESWKSPDQLAQQLFMIASDEPPAALSVVDAAVKARSDAAQKPPELPAPDVRNYQTTHEQGPEQLPLERQLEIIQQASAPTFAQETPTPPPQYGSPAAAPTYGPRRGRAAPTFESPEEVATQQAILNPSSAPTYGGMRQRVEAAFESPAVDVTPPPPAPYSDYEAPDVPVPGVEPIRSPALKARPDFSEFSDFNPPPVHLEYPELDWNSLVDVGGGGGTSTFIGLCVEDQEGPDISVDLYPNGPNGTVGSTVIVHILQLADSEIIPALTWISGIQQMTDDGGGTIYCAQVPIWLA